MLFNPDGSYDLNAGAMKIKELLNYQEDLAAFKVRNNWNQRKRQINGYLELRKKVCYNSY